MKVVELQAENIKRIRAVAITPTGPVVTIGGKNGQGKSSVLDAIAMAIGGEKLAGVKPLRSGAKKGRVRVDLGDLVVTRTFTAAGGGTLVVANKDGARYPSPQSVLDKLIGKLTFDPLAFAQMKDVAQAETLRQVVGLDTRDLDTTRKALFDERTIVNRDAKALEAQLDAQPWHADAPATPVSIEALAAELDRIAGLQKGKDDAQRDAATADSEVTRAEARAQVARSALERLEREVTKARAAVKEAEALKRTAVETAGRVRAAAETLDVPDAEAVRVQLRDAEQVNAKVRANVAHDTLAQQLEAKQRRVGTLTEGIIAADEAKAQRIAQATFPVDGLAIDDTGVTFKGEPFSQASTAEQLRVSVAMGLALNPTLKVLLIRQGSALDAGSLAMVAEMAAAADAQIWIERVAEDGAGVSVLIEDGAVAEAAELKEAV